MKKKILASLLVSPMAFGAFAGITPPGMNNENLMDGKDWTQDGVTGSTEVFTGTEVNCPIGVGSIQRTLMKVYPGKYTLSITDAKNATITVAGTTVEADGDKEFTFEVKGDKAIDVTLEITPTTAAAFGFKGLTIELDFEASSVKAPALTAIEALTDPNSKFTETEAYKDVVTLREGVEEIFNALSSSDPADVWAAYGKYELWNLKDGSCEKIDEKVDAYNAAAQALNLTIGAENFYFTWNNLIDANLRTFPRVSENLNNEIKKVSEEKRPFVNAYAWTKAKAYLNPLETGFNNLKTELETAYKNGTLEGADVQQGIKDKYNPMQQKLWAFEKPETDGGVILSGKLYIQDAKNYYVATTWPAGVEKAIKDGEKAINDLSGVNGFQDAFKAQKDEWAAAVATKYTTEMQTVVNGAAPVAIPGTIGPDDTLSDALIAAVDALAVVDEETKKSAYTTAKETYDEALKAIGDFVAEKSAKVTEQNTLMNKALDEVAKVNIPATESPTLKPLINEQAVLLGNIKADLVEKYSALALDQAYVDGIAPQIADINKALDEAGLTDALAKYDAAYAKWETLKKYITTNIDYTNSPIKGVFTTNLSQIKSAIDAIGPNTTDGDIQAINNSIDAATTNAQEMVKMLQSVESKWSSYKTAYGTSASTRNKHQWYVAQITKLSGVTVADPEATQKTKFESEYNGLKNLTSQAAFDALTALNNNLPSNTTTYFTTALNTYANLVIKANAASVKTKVDALKAPKPDAYADCNIIIDQIAKINSDFASVSGKTVNATSQSAAVTAANNITKEISAVQTAVDVCTWAETQLKTLSTVKATVAAAETTNNNTSWSPAKEYFDGVIAGMVSSRTTYVDGVKTAISNSAKNTTLASNISSLLTEANGLGTKITTNQSFYVNLLETAKTVQNSIKEVQGDLDNLVAVPGADQEALAQQKAWQDRINEYTDELNGINVDRDAEYAKGNVGTTSPTLDQSYADLKNKIGKLKNEMLGGDDVIAAVKAEYLEVWSKRYQALRAQYNTSVEAYNNYSSKWVTNSGLYEAILRKYPTLGNHEDIYPFSDKITALDDYVTGQIKAATKVITEEMYNGFIAGTDKIPGAEAMAAGMTTLVTDMQSDVQAEAVKYYNDQIAKADKAYTDAIADMKAAGIVDKITIGEGEDAKEVSIAENSMVSVLALINAQKEAYNEYETTVPEVGKEKEDVVKFVNGLCNNLDKLYGETGKIVTAENAAAAEQWPITYAVDQKKRDKWQKEVNDFDPKPEPDNEDLKAFDAAMAAIKAIQSAPAFKNFESQKSTLDTEMTKLETAYNKLKTAYDNAQAYEALQTKLGELKADYAELQQIADGLAGEVAISGIGNKIAEAEQAFEEEKSYNEIKPIVDGIETALNTGYDALVTTEKEELGKLMSLIKQAFNDARAAGKLGTEAEANAKNAQIDDYQAQIDDLKIDPTAEKDPQTPEQFKEKAANLEETLSNELVSLQGLTPDKPSSVDQALTELNTKYEQVYGAVVAGQTTLGGYDADVQAKYAEKYQNLLKDLETIADNVAAYGSKIVLYKGDVMADIDKVETALEALNQEAEALNEVYTYTKENKATVQEAIDKASTAVDAALAKVGGWNVAGWDASINTLKTARLVAIQDALDKAATIITDNPDGQNNPDGLTTAEKDEFIEIVKSVTDELDYYVSGAALQYADDNRTAAQNAINDARQGLNNSEVVGSAELSAKIAEQEQALKNAEKACQDALVEAGNDKEKIEAAYVALAEAAKTIKEAVSNINTEIEENTYVIGDVDGSGGQPDVADVQTLVGWVGYGVTLQEIREAYGAAREAAADVNGSKTLNIGDVTALCQIILNEPGNSPRRMMAPRYGEGEAFYSIARTSEEARMRTYAVGLANSGTFIAAQIDVKMPAGMTLTDAKLTERAANHQIEVYDNGDGRYRLLIYSMENIAFAGQAGELVTLYTEGIGTPEVTAMTLSTPMHSTVEGGNEGTSMLDSIIEGAHNMKERVYDAAGRSLRAVQRGINIIRHSDGTTTKELRK